MTPDHLQVLISLARAGLASRSERMPSDKIMEAASALAAAEGQLVAMQHQEAQPKAGKVGA